MPAVTVKPEVREVITPAEVTITVSMEEAQVIYAYMAHTYDLSEWED